MTLGVIQYLLPFTIAISKKLARILIGGQIGFLIGGLLGLVVMILVRYHRHHAGFWRHRRRGDWDDSRLSCAYWEGQIPDQRPRNILKRNGFM